MKDNELKLEDVEDPNTRWILPRRGRATQRARHEAAFSDVKMALDEKRTQSMN